jgi:hypothetical protein
VRLPAQDPAYSFVLGRLLSIAAHRLQIDSPRALLALIYSPAVCCWPCDAGWRYRQTEQSLIGDGEKRVYRYSLRLLGPKVVARLCKCRSVQRIERFQDVSNEISRFRRIHTVFTPVRSPDLDPRSPPPCPSAAARLQRLQPGIDRLDGTVQALHNKALTLRSDKRIQNTFQNKFKIVRNCSLIVSA